MRPAFARNWISSLAIGLLLALPTHAHAEEDVGGPQFACVPQTLRIMAADVSGLRLQCEVTDAPSGDLDFTIELDQQAGDVAQAGASPLGVRTVCSGSLSSGAGACIGAIFNTASPAFGEARVSATFLPSGTRLEDASAGPAPQSPPGDGTPVRFEPLPEP